MGELREVRLSNYIVRDDEKFVMNPAMESGPLGPNLDELSKGESAKGAPFQWEKETVAKGYFLANLAGSVHQSYTGDEGATLLLLWSGHHADVNPDQCQVCCEELRP